MPAQPDANEYAASLPSGGVQQERAGEQGRRDDRQEGHRGREAVQALVEALGPEAARLAGEYPAPTRPSPSSAIKSATSRVSHRCLLMPSSMALKAAAKPTCMRPVSMKPP